MTTYDIIRMPIKSDITIGKNLLSGLPDWGGGGSGGNIGGGGDGSNGNNDSGSICGGGVGVNGSGGSSVDGRAAGAAEAGEAAIIKTPTGINDFSPRLWLPL